MNASAAVLEAECKMIDEIRQSGKDLAPLRYWVNLGLHGPYVNASNGYYRVFHNPDSILYRYCKSFKIREEAQDYRQAVLQLFNLYTVTRGNMFQLTWKAPNGKK